jgi:hypothetical protein
LELLESVVSRQYRNRCLKCSGEEEINKKYEEEGKIAALQQMLC